MNTDASQFAQTSYNSCSNCRRRHKKCDRVLPICSACVKNNLNCCYENVGKRGPKTNSEYNPFFARFRLVRNRANISAAETSQIRPKLTSPDISFVKLLRAHIYAENEFAQEAPIDNSFETEELALVCAIRACEYVHCGQLERAEEMYEKSKTICMSKYDLVLQSSIVATCFLYLGGYCYLIDDKTRAAFFINNLKSYLNKNNGEGAKFLQELLNYMKRIFTNGMDVDFLMKTIIKQHQLLREYALNEIDQDRLKLSKVLNILVELDLSSELEQQFHWDSNRICSLSTKLLKLYDRLTGILPDPVVQQRRYTAAVLCQGLHLLLNLRAGNIDMARRHADLIVHTTYNNQAHNVLVGPVIVHAANTHLQILNKLRNFSEQSSVIDSIAMELQILTMMQQKNSLLGIRFSSTIIKLENVLRLCQEHMMLHNIYHHQSYLFDTQTNDMEQDIDSVNHLGFLLVPQEETNDLIDQFFKDFE